MINKFKILWNKSGFEILVGICILFILIIGMYNIISGKKGKWKGGINFELPVKKRGPPKESRGEIECRRVLENLYKKPFNKTRPDFLRNPVTGGEYNLELDCYNPDIQLIKNNVIYKGLAGEYNGQQHYKFIPYFHKNKETFLNQKYRDDMKRRICKENNVALIEVPYTVKIDDIKNFLTGECEKYRILN
jgi:hypothetical protein